MTTSVPGDIVDVTIRGAAPHLIRDLKVDEILTDSNLSMNGETA